MLVHITKVNGSLRGDSGSLRGQRCARRWPAARMARHGVDDHLGLVSAVQCTGIRTTADAVADNKLDNQPTCG